jgi:Protein of unknown function (DUF2442)
MNFFEYNATKVWFTSNEINIQLANGKTASLPLDNFPILKKASQAQLNEVEIIDGYALYWPTLNEDLSVEGFFVQQNSLLTN